MVAATDRTLPIEVRRVLSIRQRLSHSIATSEKSMISL